MIIQRLIEPETRKQFPVHDEVGFDLQNVNWVLNLDESGKCLAAVPLSETRIRGKKETQTNSEKKLIMTRPASKGNVTFPRITDTGEYLLGLVEKTTERAAKRHQAYIDLVQRCYDETGVEHLQALLRFLEHLEIPDDVASRISAKDVIDVRVNSRLLSDWPAIRAFWTRTVDACEEDAVLGQCLVCGQHDVPIARIHSVQIKRVPGGGMAGATIVSANDEVYFSYGKEQSAIAPTCVSCARTYALVLNQILRTERNRRVFGDAVMAYWTKSGGESSLEFLLSSPQPEEIAKLIDAVKTGKRATVEADAFYSVVLSRHEARIVVRDWVEVPVADLDAHVATFFEQQQVLPDWRFRGVIELCESLVPTVIPKAERLRRLPGNLLPSTLLAVLRGRELPAQLLSLALERTRTEGMGGLGALPGMTGDDRKEAYDKLRLAENRAAVITLILKEKGVSIAMGLDTNRDEVAYLCGRLLAVLEQIQYKAVGEVNANLADRFFGSASRTPSVVLPTLISRAKSHQGKIRRESPGLANLMTQQVEEIADRIDAFPRHLTTEQQGLFDLGYLHQTAHDRTERADKAAAKREAAAAAAE